MLQKTKDTIDASQINEIIIELQENEFKNKASGENEPLKQRLLKLLDKFKMVLSDVEHAKITIKKLQKLFGFDKGSTVNAEAAANDNQEDKGEDSSSKGAEESKKRRKRKGNNGRYGFSDYPNAAIEYISLEDYNIGDCCPDCRIGKLYKGEHRKLLNFSGQAPFGVKRYKKEVLRCNACQKEYIAKGVVPKWENSARSTAVIQKCNGVPFYRLSKMQESYGVAVARSTIWSLCLTLWNMVGKVIYYELLSQAEKCRNYYIDDTGARVLSVISSNNKLARSGQQKEKSCNSTVVCTTLDTGEQMVIYITKQDVAGKNCANLVKEGGKNIMIDASNSNNLNLPDAVIATINIFNCIAHGYRKFEEIAEYYPKETEHLIAQISSIYKIDKITKTEKMSDEDRLLYHQENSQKHIDNFYTEIARLFDEKLVEPNSHLGKAMKYWLNNKDGLTKFLSIAGVELDNNISERKAKALILQRKNSLFFKTLNSAEILSGCTSIIETCKENNISSFHYLNWLQENASKVIKTPTEYLPWKYKKYMECTERIKRCA